jgi:hypothetical protein
LASTITSPPKIGNSNIIEAWKYEMGATFHVLPCLARKERRVGKAIAVGFKGPHEFRCTPSHFVSFPTASLRYKTLASTSRSQGCKKDMYALRYGIYLPANRIIFYNLILIM